MGVRCGRLENGAEEQCLKILIGKWRKATLG